MTFYLSAYRADPAADYLFARVRRAPQEIEPDLQIGLHVVYLQADKHLVTLYPWGKTYPVTDAEWERWSQLKEADGISMENTGICYCFYQASAGEATLVTGLACNTNCLMCPVSEGSRRHAKLTPLAELQEQLRYFGTDLPHITITGGEPTLLRMDLLEVFHTAKRLCPCAELLLLTNGRAFAVAPYAQALGQLLTAQDQIAIPIHGSTGALHDAITQVPGSWQQTMQGLHHLAKSPVRIEIRIVVSKQNLSDVDAIVDLVLGLPRVTVVHFIGLEMCGNAIKNKDLIWVDYSQAAAACEAGIQKLMAAGIDVGLYNFPLCAVRHQDWTLCRNSISDYKIRYAPACASCSVQSICSGVFDSTLSTGCFHPRPILG